MDATAPRVVVQLESRQRVAGFTRIKDIVEKTKDGQPRSECSSESLYNARNDLRSAVMSSR